MDIRLVEPFINSTESIIKQMTGINILAVEEPLFEEHNLSALGITSIINFGGIIKGRFVIDINSELAVKMTSNILMEDISSIKDRNCLAAISEMSNIIAGDANTFINNKYNLSLRLTPPISFIGEQLTISTSKIDSFTVIFKTELGVFKINIAFQGGME